MKPALALYRKNKLDSTFPNLVNENKPTLSLCLSLYAMTTKTSLQQVKIIFGTVNMFLSIY